jgi:transcriptional regulator with XRE-family HTH domain
VPVGSDQQNFLSALGARVRRARMARQRTQEWLAEQVGINPRTVQKIEAGQLNILVTTLNRIQRALRCRWDELLGG